MSARPVFLALLLLCTFESSLASGRGPWSAGWGFTETGGIPLQPPGLQSYMLNRSVMGLFVANNTGLASPKELAAELTLGTIGIGWNLDHLHTSQACGWRGAAVSLPLGLTGSTGPCWLTRRWHRGSGAAASGRPQASST